MEHKPCIAVIGTFDSKAEEHEFLDNIIHERGCSTITINVGTKKPPSFSADIDLYDELVANDILPAGDRDEAISAMLALAKEHLETLHRKGAVKGAISAGGGSGTHLCSSIMKVLPLGIPKVMVSTVASRNMAEVVGTRDITMMHSVVDLLGVNSISGGVLERAAAAVCAMAESKWTPQLEKRRVALSFFGFITPAAEGIRQHLGKMGYEVIAFHANGTGGMAMEELAAEGYFCGILDLATHELADDLKGGYCGGIGFRRFRPAEKKALPRLVVPGGMDCAVLEFTRDDIPPEYRDRPIFFYDFRSAVRLSRDESAILAKDLAGRLNTEPSDIRVLVPTRGWSAADCEGGPLYDPSISSVFMETFTSHLDPIIEVREADFHINDPEFARLASQVMDRMVRERY